MSEKDVEHNQNHQDKLDKAKEIIKKNWKPFTVGVVLTTVTFVVTKRVTMRYMPNLNIVDTITYNRLFGILSKQEINTNIIKVYTDGRGRPGNFVHLYGRPEIAYPSQTEAAKIFGVTDKVMSRHLNGHIPDIKGYRLVRPVV